MKRLYIKLLPLIIFLGTCAIFIYAGYTQAGKLAQYEREKTIMEVSNIRTKLEAELNSRINLTRGLAAFAGSKDNLSQEDFNKFSKALIRDDDYIINFSILENTTMRFVYPYEPNKAALGVDLSLVPEQARDIFLAKNTMDPVLSIPLDLVQGGTGIVSRISICKNTDEGLLFWGIASVAIDIDRLLDKSCLSNHPGLVLFLEGPSNIDFSSQPIFGSKDSLDKDPVVMDIQIQGALWHLSATPKTGWKNFYWLAFIVSALGFVVAMTLAISVYNLIQSKASLKILALHDQLTGLPNRLLFWDRFSVEIKKTQREGSLLCVFMIDLDFFKEINDEYGHEAGDRLLAETARRMTGAVRQSDTVARLGGDEFAVLAPIDATNGLEELAKHLRSCFDAPFDLGAISKVCTASIGHALYPLEGSNAETVLSLADERMYSEKHEKHKKHGKHR